MTRVRNMGRILSAFLMLGISSMCGAQIYKYLGIEDGLSNRRIYRIQKDGSAGESLTEISKILR